MRAWIAIAAVAIGNVRVGVAQQSTTVDTSGLGRTVRAALVNAVLRDRWNLFHQPALIARCDLAKLFGSTVGDSVSIGGGVPGREDSDKSQGCEQHGADGLDDSVVIAVVQIRRENREYVAIDGSSRRMHGFMVVRLEVGMGKSASHIEEWVMRPTVTGWATVTVRFFGFVVA